MQEKRKCTVCGKEFIPDYPMQMKCPNCDPGRKRLKSNGKRNRWDGNPGLPEHCFFETFYDERGKLKREIFIEAAREVAEIFTRNDIKATSLRKFFSMVKSVEQRLYADPNLGIEDVRASIYKIIPIAHYQYNRGIIKKVLVDFLEENCETAIKSKKEFKGFAQYFTSVICYAKQK